MAELKKNLRTYLEEFIVYKQHLGYVYESQKHYLKRYVSYVEKSDPEGMPTKGTIDEYLDTLKDSPGSHYGTGCALREFTRHLAGLGMDVYVPSQKISRQPTPDPPYFFTEEEIQHFFTAADSFKANRNYPGREIIIPALFRMMYCCGTRCKEARMLLCAQVSFSERYIDILQSKGHKDRRLYISEDLCGYLQEYDRQISALYPGREYFFPGVDGHPYLSGNFVSGNFRRCWDKAFPDFQSDNYPRAYDFRHHFAWANINRWAVNGMDVNAMLPYLMKYMGHATVNQTLYYFHFVPDFYPTYKSMAAGSDDIIPEVPE